MFWTIGFVFMDTCNHFVISKNIIVKLLLIYLLAHGLLDFFNSHLFAICDGLLMVLVVLQHGPFVPGNLLLLAFLPVFLPAFLYTFPLPLDINLWGKGNAVGHATIQMIIAPLLELFMVHRLRTCTCSCRHVQYNVA